MGYRTLVIDFDDLRSADLVAGVAQNVVYDWGDVMLERCAAQDAICDANGLSVLASPRSYADVTKPRVKALMRQLDDTFDYILIDAPAGIGEGLALACAGAYRGIVVATADPVSVRSACTAAGVMDTFGVKNTRLLINRAVKKDMRKRRLLNIDDVIDKTEVQLIGIIPEDKKLRLAPVNGIALEKLPTARVPLMNVANRILGKHVPLFFL